jgi:penicillin G amidase
MGYLQAAQRQADMERLLAQMIQAGLPRGRLEEIFPGRLEGLDIGLVRRVRLGERLVPGSVRWATGLPRALASNNWVIAPSRTRSGRAILASDPHLEVGRLPAVWYEPVLELDGRFAIGAAIPGLPLLAIGRTSDLAWAPTYGCMDTVDSWIEDCRDGRYRKNAAGQDRWEPFRTRTELIRRKHHPGVTLTFYETTTGYWTATPASRACTSPPGGRGRAPAPPRWPAGFALLRAANVADGMDAARRIETSWNWVLADSAGDIGYQHSGRMPVRRDGWSGLVPLPGWDPHNDWAGFAAPHELPRVRNP